MNRSNELKMSNCAEMQLCEDENHTDKLMASVLISLLAEVPTAHRYITPDT